MTAAPIPMAPPNTVADPEQIRAEIDALLAGLGTADRASIPQRARILEQAHDLLVDALATVDKI